MNPDSDDAAIKTTKHIQAMLAKAGLIDRSVFDESTKQFRYDWTPEGIRFRDAILKAYDAIAKTEGKNSLAEFCGLVGFVIAEHR